MLITEILHYRRIYTGSGENEINYDTNLKLGKFNAFGQVSKSYLEEKLKSFIWCPE